MPKKRTGGATADHPTRTRLLRAGLAIARRSGLRAVAVRGVAARARVNLGSFVYHFGNRDAFIAELMEHWYGPFYARLQVTVDREVAPVERLRLLLEQLADFVIEHRAFVAHVLMDAAAGEAGARRFVHSLAGRHPALVLQAVVEAQRAGDFVAAPPLNAMAFLFASLGAPILMLGGAVDSGLLPKPFVAQVRGDVLDRAGAQQRIDWALRALAADPTRHAMKKDLP